MRFVQRWNSSLKFKKSEEGLRPSLSAQVSYANLGHP
jgi:hypothetical protein